MTLLREDLLVGRVVVAAGPVRDQVRRSLEGLGARVEAFDHYGDDDAAQAWAHACAPLHGLVYDAAAFFGQGGRDGLLASIEHGWTAIRAVGAGALIPAGAGGRIVLIAPIADAQPHSRAARAALENLARSLSIEWARHSISATMLAPGIGTTDADIATLVAFLLSPGGAYYSGARFELGALRA